MTIKAFIKRHSIPTYFALTFAISWIGVLLVVGPNGFPGSEAQFQRLLPLVFLAMVAGPSLTGILLTGIVDGRRGLREFFSRLCLWRINIRWYVVALLTAPLLLTTTIAALALVSPVFVPGIITTNDKTGLLIFSVMGGVAAGFFEEIGWTGFAIPKMQLKHSALATGLMVGVLWTMWHLLSNFFWGGASLPVFLWWGAVLIAYRVLMVWVYNYTESLLLAQIMHVSLTSSQFILPPSVASAADNALWSAVFAASLCFVVAIVVTMYGGRRLVRETRS